jgi:7,8-dihydropterin-6-yl-methyl-4-(beta-D-ribofuranosyl)aminobenzene 5'-phosphate synthase
VPRNTETVSDKGLVRRESGKWAQDMIEDDASLVIGTRKGPVVLFGCAHAGIGNILGHIRGKLGIETVHAIIGGTHLGFRPKSAVRQAIELFEQFEVNVVGTAHCTGEGPNRALKEHFGERFRNAWAGTVFEF